MLQIEDDSWPNLEQNSKPMKKEKETKTVQIDSKNWSSDSVTSRDSSVSKVTRQGRIYLFTTISTAALRYIQSAYPRC